MYRVLLLYPLILAIDRMLSLLMIICATLGDTLCIIGLLLSLYIVFTAMIRTQFGLVIKNFLLDFLEEYFSHKFRCLLTVHITLPQLSCPYIINRMVLQSESIVILWTLLPHLFWVILFRDSFGLMLFTLPSILLTSLSQLSF